MHPSEPGTQSAGAYIEGQEYRDEGCEISPSCLRCPLPRCKYDDPQYAQAQRRRQRDNLVVQAHVREGLVRGGGGPPLRTESEDHTSNFKEERIWKN